MRDFLCPDCGHQFEALVKSGDTTEECQACGSYAESALLTPPRVGLYNDPSTRAEALKKRSREHSNEYARKNPEEIAAKMGAKPKSQNPWNIRNKK